MADIEEVPVNSGEDFPFKTPVKTYKIRRMNVTTGKIEIITKTGPDKRLREALSKSNAPTST